MPVLGWLAVIYGAVLVLGVLFFAADELRGRFSRRDLPWRCSACGREFEDSRGVHAITAHYQRYHGPPRGLEDHWGRGDDAF